jgi:hypothetical protein
MDELADQPNALVGGLPDALVASGRQVDVLYT